MGTVVAAMAASHAFTVMEPEAWDQFREMNRQHYKRLYGVEPPLHPKLESETLENVKPRYERVRQGLDFLHRHLRETQPGAFLLIGDDQNENYSEQCLPQLAIYTGERVVTSRHEFECHQDLSEALSEGMLHAGFDVAVSRKFPDDRLLSHAHVHLLERLLPEGDIPVVLIFVESIHAPAVDPPRCYAFGQALRSVIESNRPAGERIAVCASGGLSHFSAAFPYHAYSGPFHYGSISEEFDRKALEMMTRGEGEALATSLSSSDLLAHGDIELRSWLTVLGMMGKAKAEILAYEPFYRAIMAMGVAYWQIES